MEKKISLFHHVSCVMPFDSALSVVAVIVVSGMVALESFGASPAHGDEGCWSGAAWSCEQSTPTPRGPVVPQIWTAIAISKSTLRNATAWQAQTQYDAEKAALDRCGTVSSDCVIAISGANTCIALALSLNRAWSTSQADNYIGADNEALAGCTARGGTNCVVTADPCYNDGPVNNGYTSLAP